MNPVMSRTRRRIRLTSLLAAGLSIFSLGGCAVSTGFKGPDYDPRIGVTAPDGGPLVVSLTEAVLKPGLSNRAAFRGHVRLVEASLRDQPGLVGYALRTELVGAKLWTMTVWRDEASLKTFLRSDAHRTAVRKVMDVVERSTFVRTPIEPRDVPLSWEQALALMEREGYSYQ